MSPIGARHAACIKRLLALLAPLSAGRATVSIRDPLVLGTHEEPQPDVTLLVYRADGSDTALPLGADALLVIEVTDSSLARDRGEKLPLYDGAFIPETWLVNPPRDWGRSPSRTSWRAYTHVHTARRGETIAPLAFPDLPMRVDDILGFSGWTRF